MPDKSNKYLKNVPGIFYVDNTCIHCDACVLVAEKHFKLDDNNDGHAFVCAQPQTEEEELLCQEALESCPVESIGNDGETNT